MLKQGVEQAQEILAHWISAFATPSYMAVQFGFGRILVAFLVACHGAPLSDGFKRAADLAVHEPIYDTPLDTLRLIVIIDLKAGAADVTEGGRVKVEEFCAL